MIPNLTMKLWAFLILFYFLSLVDAKIAFTLDERIHDCNTNGSKTFINCSGLNLTIVGDTETVWNGKFVIVKEIKNKWRMRIFGERYDRGTWNLMFQKTMVDFCYHILNPTEV